MKLQLYKINDRYAFSVGEFHSPSHFFLCANIKPTYKYAWEAYRDANNLYRKQKIHIDTIQRIAEDDLSVQDLAAETKSVSAEEMITKHYNKIYEIIAARCEAFKDEEEKEIVYKSIKSVVSGILKIKEELESPEDKKKIENVIKKFRKLVHEKFSALLEKDKLEMEKQENSKQNEQPPALNEEEILNGGQSQATPPPQDASAQETLPIVPAEEHKIDSIIRYASDTSDSWDDVRKELLDEYAERACHAIEKNHPEAICKINYDNRSIKITTASGQPMLRITMNEDYNVSSVEPEGDLAKGHPLYSSEFYQRYWKPIVEKVGHCYIQDLGITICSSKCALPDIPNKTPHSSRLFGWSIKDKEERPFDLCFEGSDPMWKFKKVSFVKEAKSSKYTEEDFIRGQPKRVKCIDPNIKSLLGKIGEVRRVIPLSEHLEIEIDFGRQTVRLTENQIELLNDGIPTTV